MNQEPKDIVSLPTDNSVQKVDNSLSIKELFYKYIRFLPFVVLSVAIALLIAYTYLRYAQPSYSSAGVIQLEIKTGKSSGGDKVEDLLYGTTKVQSLQSQLEIIKSKPLMERVVNRLELQLNYTAIGRIRSENIYKKSPFYLRIHELKDSTIGFSYHLKFSNSEQFEIAKLNVNTTVSKPFTTPYGTFSIEPLAPIASGSEFQVDWIPTKSVAAMYANALMVAPKAGSNSLVLSLETSNPFLTADIINSAMVQYDSVTIEQNNFSTDQMIGFIDIRLDTLKKELDELQAKVIDYRVKANLVVDADAVTTNYYNNLNKSQDKLIEGQAQLLSIEMIESYLTDKNNEFKKSTAPSSLGIPDITLNSLITNYNNAQVSRQTLIESNIPVNHPSVKEADGLIEKNRIMIIESLKNLKKSVTSKIRETEKQDLLSQKELHELPEKQKELLGLERQVTTKLALYELLEKRREEASISRASTISTSKIIDEAGVSFTPSKPNKSTIRLIAIVLGILVPVAIIMLLEMLNDKINSKNDITRVSNVPILGEVGRSSMGKTLVVGKTSRTMVAEQFRTIRSNLQYVINNIQKPVIMITSSFSGEGKSFISTNLGAVLALSGKKTIILEFDIRKPMLLAGLGMIKKPGISNFIVGKAPLETLILPVQDTDNLFVLPCGPIPPNPSELLLDTKINDIFTYLKNSFDIIIIDTAPVGIVSDALTLGKYADASLYITRQGYTYKKQINIINDLYENKKIPKMSVIVNDITSGHGYGYYGYGKYGYSYTKNDYYTQEEGQSKSWLKEILNFINPLKWFSKK